MLKFRSTVKYINSQFKKDALLQKEVMFGTVLSDFLNVNSTLEKSPNYLCYLILQQIQKRCVHYVSVLLIEFYCFQIKVEDGGNPPLASLTRVFVTVIDENDNDPKFHLSPYPCQILEMLEVNQDAVLCQVIIFRKQTITSDTLYILNFCYRLFAFDISQVIASDADSGPNGEVTYTIAEGKDSDIFSINSKTGAIFAKQKIQAGEAYDFKVIN